MTAMLPTLSVSLAVPTMSLRMSLSWELHLVISTARRKQRWAIRTCGWPRWRTTATGGRHLRFRPESAKAREHITFDKIGPTPRCHWRPKWFVLQFSLTTLFFSSSVEDAKMWSPRFHECATNNSPVVHLHSSRSGYPVSSIHARRVIGQGLMRGRWATR